MKKVEQYVEMIEQLGADVGFENDMKNYKKLISKLELMQKCIQEVLEILKKSGDKNV